MSVEDGRRSQRTVVEIGDRRAYGFFELRRGDIGSEALCNRVERRGGDTFVEIASVCSLRIVVHGEVWTGAVFVDVSNCIKNYVAHLIKKHGSKGHA